MSWLLPADHSVLKQTLRRIVPNAHSITSFVIVLLPTSTMFNPHVCYMLSPIRRQDDDRTSIIFYEENCVYKQL